MTTPIPTIGRIVHYTLTHADADAINRRREDARRNIEAHREHKLGVIVHVGNSVQAGETYPLIITRVWGTDPTSQVNGQLLLDGNDVYWITSVQVGEGMGKFSWPERKVA